MSPSTEQNVVAPSRLAEALASLRAGAPLVQCLTNVVAAGSTANVLLAAGASPAMVDNPEEAGEFSRIADGVLVNLGTPYAITAEAMETATLAATAAGTPWVLDPVGAGPLRWRTSLAHKLLEQRPPAVVRGNASEVMALDGGAGGRGVDAADSADKAHDAANALALRSSTVVAVSGEVDHLTDGDRLVRVANGHPLLTRMTGTGCALGALIAGFAAANEDALLAATAATAMLNVAAEDAAESAHGPGSFAVALLDSLAGLTPERLADRVRLS
jgi:hydroxyethylthiazole kinase